MSDTLHPLSSRYEETLKQQRFGWKKVPYRALLDVDAQTIANCDVEAIEAKIKAYQQMHSFWRFFAWLFGAIGHYCTLLFLYRLSSLQKQLQTLGPAIEDDILTTGIDSNMQHSQSHAPRHPKDSLASWEEAELEALAYARARYKVDEIGQSLWALLDNESKQEITSDSNQARAKEIHTHFQQAESRFDKVLTLYNKDCHYMAKPRYFNALARRVLQYKTIIIALIRHKFPTLGRLFDKTSPTSERFNQQQSFHELALIKLTPEQSNQDKQLFDAYCHSRRSLIGVFKPKPSSYPALTQQFNRCRQAFTAQYQAILDAEPKSPDNPLVTRYQHYRAELESMINRATDAYLKQHAAVIHTNLQKGEALLASLQDQLTQPQSQRSLIDLESLLKECYAHYQTAQHHQDLLHEDTKDSIDNRYQDFMRANQQSIEALVTAINHQGIEFARQRLTVAFEAVKDELQSFKANKNWSQDKLKAEYTRLLQHYSDVACVIQRHCSPLGHGSERTNEFSAHINKFVSVHQQHLKEHYQLVHYHLHWQLTPYLDLSTYIVDRNLAAFVDKATKGIALTDKQRTGFEILAKRFFEMADKLFVDYRFRADWVEDKLTYDDINQAEFDVDISRLQRKLKVICKRYETAFEQTNGKKSHDFFFEWKEFFLDILPALYEVGTAELNLAAAPTRALIAQRDGLTLRESSIDIIEEYHEFQCSQQRQRDIAELERSIELARQGAAQAEERAAQARAEREAAEQRTAQDRAERKAAEQRAAQARAKREAAEQRAAQERTEREAAEQRAAQESPLCQASCRMNYQRQWSRKDEKIQSTI